MFKFKVLLIALSVVVILATFGGIQRAGAAPRLIKIAYSVDTVDETQQVALDAAKARVAELNASRTDVQVELTIYDAQSSVDKQISDVQNALIKKPDVLIFSAVDAVGSLPAAQAAKDAGVKLIDRRPTNPEPDLFDVAFYSNDEDRYSKATVDWITAYLKAHADVVLKVGLIYGAPAQTAQLLRMDVIKSLAKQMPDRIKILAEGYGNWKTDTAQNFAQDWLQAHPDMNYIAAANDIMATGVSNAVVTAGKTGQVLISGYDLTDDGLQRIKAGTQDFDTGVSIQDSNQIIDVAVGLALGTFKDRTYHQNPVYGATKDNVDQIIAKLKPAAATTEAPTGAATQAANAAPRLIKIAYSVDTVDETQQVALDAAKARVAEVNASRTDVQVELTIYDAQSSVDKQISDVQNALIKKPDVLIFSAVDAVGSLPAAQAAKDAGVKLIDRRPTNPEPDLFDVAFYSNDEDRYSKATVDWITAYLKAHADVVLKVGLIYGAPAQTAQLLRMDVIKSLAKQMPDRIKILAEGYGNWKTDTAQNFAQDWLQAHPDMNYIAAANDIMATGVSNAVVTAGKTGQVLISGYDLTTDGLQRIKAGTQDFDTGVIIQDSNQIIDVAVKLALGTFKDRAYHQDPVYAATKDNVDELLAKLKK